MSAAFTPGPWAIQKPNSDDKRRIIAPNQSGFDVCCLVRSANDARLIVAAPELYWALDLAREHMLLNDVATPRVMEKIDEALSKARSGK